MREINSSLRKEEASKPCLSYSTRCNVMKGSVRQSGLRRIGTSDINSDPRRKDAQSCPGIVAPEETCLSMEWSTHRQGRRQQGSRRRRAVSCRGSSGFLPFPVFLDELRSQCPTSSKFPASRLMAISKNHNAWASQRPAFPFLFVTDMHK